MSEEAANLDDMETITIASLIEILEENIGCLRTDIETLETRIFALEHDLVEIHERQERQ
jgi:hypothetical protein